jgi:hypothetical protein
MQIEMTEEIQSQLNGAKHIFFGMLQGISSKISVHPPAHVYHYTSWEKFCSMTESNSVRMHTVSNFEDQQERKLLLPIESRVSGQITDKISGEIHDFSPLLNDELSRNHVFIQSNTSSSRNSYLWKKYGDNGSGVCLRFSTRSFIEHLNYTVPDFENLPNYLKCCYMSYESEWLNSFMEVCLEAIVQTNEKLGNIGTVAWFFLLEYWRNFVKTPHPYKAEEEVRFVVSENYSVFLYICSLLSKWGCFTTSHPEELSKAFYDQYIAIKNQLRERLNFCTHNNTSYVSIPLYTILESVTIGPNSGLSKEKVAMQTSGRIRKSQIDKSFLIL